MEPAARTILRKNIGVSDGGPGTNRPPMAS